MDQYNPIPDSNKFDAEKSDQALYLEAERIVKKKLEFYSHLITYLIVNCGIWTINLMTTPNQIWAIWPTLGWGIGIACHAADVFLYGKTSNFRRRLIEKEMEKLSKK